MKRKGSDCKSVSGGICHGQADECVAGLGSWVGVHTEVSKVTSLTRLGVSYNLLDQGGQGVKLLGDTVFARQGFTLLDQRNA